MFHQQGQQQGQGQFMSQGFSPMAPFPSFPTYFDANPHPHNMNNYSSNIHEIHNDENGHIYNAKPSKNVYHEGEQGNNRFSYQRNENQEQYASYPRDAVYHRSNGPGWQRQEVHYPPRPYQ